jgi:hypothetical protein
VLSPALKPSGNSPGDGGLFYGPFAQVPNRKDTPHVSRED